MQQHISFEIRQQKKKTDRQSYKANIIVILPAKFRKLISKCIKNYSAF